MKRLGYVLWFDDSSGEGQIADAKTGEIYYCHYSAIKNPNKPASERRTLKKNQAVEFVLYVNLYMIQIDSVWVVEFNYSIENEHKLNRLMNYLFELNDPALIDIANEFYKTG